MPNWSFRRIFAVLTHIVDLAMILAYLKKWCEALSSGVWRWPPLRGETGGSPGLLTKSRFFQFYDIKKWRTENCRHGLLWFEAWGIRKKSQSCISKPDSGTLPFLAPNMVNKWRFSKFFKKCLESRSEVFKIEFSVKNNVDSDSQIIISLRLQN